MRSRQQRKGNDQLAGYRKASWLAFGLGLLLLVWQTSELNTRTGNQLMAIGSLPGLILGILSGVYLHRRYALDGAWAAQRKTILRNLLVGMSLASAALALLWNKNGRQDEPISIVGPILEKRLGGRRGSAYLIEVNLEGTRETLRIDSDLYYRVEEGTSLTIQVAPGALGYRHIVAIYITPTRRFDRGSDQGPGRH